MAVYPATVEATFNSMRERTLRLEQEAAALRSDLDEMEILVQWQASHSISSEALRRIAVSDTEIALYQNQSAEKFSSSVLRYVMLLLWMHDARHAKPLPDQSIQFIS